jgi:hypothetical protein
MATVQAWPLVTEYLQFIVDSNPGKSKALAFGVKTILIPPCVLH